MIRLDIHPYCHSCPEFHPVSDISNTMSYSNEKFVTDIDVRCENHYICRRIAKYIESKAFLHTNNKTEETNNG